MNRNMSTSGAKELEHASGARISDVVVRLEIQLAEVAHMNSPRMIQGVVSSNSAIGHALHLVQEVEMRQEECNASLK